MPQVQEKKECLKKQYVGRLLNNLDRVITVFKPLNSDSEIINGFDYRYSTMMLGQGCHECVINIYNELIRQNPKDSNAYRGRGARYFRMKDYNKAVIDFNTAFLVDYESLSGKKKLGTYDPGYKFTSIVWPNQMDMPVLYLMGLAMIELGDYKDAIKVFNEVVWLDSHNANAYFERGFAKLNLNHSDWIKDYDKARIIKHNASKNMPSQIHLTGNGAVTASISQNEAAFFNQNQRQIKQAYVYPVSAVEKQQPNMQ